MTFPKDGKPEKLPEDWLGKKLLDEHSLSLRTGWDLFIKFYTMFFTVSIVALGLIIQYVHQPNRWPIVVAFVLQSTISAFTSYHLIRFSRYSSGEYEKICKHYGNLPEHAGMNGLISTPFPAWFGMGGGYLAVAGSVMLGCCWITVLFV